MNRKEIINKSLENCRLPLDEIENALIGHLCDDSNISNIAIKMNLKRGHIYQLINKLRIKGLEIPMTGHSNGGRRENSIAKKETSGEQPQVIFREIKQEKAVYNIVKITTTDKALVESILRGDL